MEWLNEWPLFLLVLVRMTAFFVAAPLFSLRGVPNTFKIGLAFFIAVITFTPVASETSMTVDQAYMLYIVKEAIVGLALGFIASLIIYTVQVAGGFIDFQMGFLIANLVDPQTGAQIPIIGNFKYIMTILFLLAVDGHHLLLEGVIRSYDLVPPQEMFMPIGSEGVTYLFTDVFVQMFASAFLIAIPVVGALFLVDVGLGILARTVPQVNVFVVGLPLKIFIGFCLILIMLPAFFFFLQSLVQNMVHSMGELLHMLGG